MQKLLMIAGGLVVCTALFLVFLPFIRTAMRPHNMMGPVAIIHGEPPKHGFAGIEFASEKSPLTVKSVVPGSGADLGGLLPGDVITAVGSIKNPDYPAFQHVIDMTLPGDTLRLTIDRGDSTGETRLRLTSFAEMVQLSAPRVSSHSPTSTTSQH